MWEKAEEVLQWQTQYYQWTNSGWKEGEHYLRSMEGEIMEERNGL